MKYLQLLSTFNYSSTSNPNNCPQSAVILTDSLATVLRFKSAVTNPHCKSTLALQFLEAADDLHLTTEGRWNNITIQWVPGHKGIAGNERADRLAKDRRTAEPFPNIHFEAVNTALKTATHRAWTITTKRQQSKTANTAAIRLPLHRWKSQTLHYLPKDQQRLILQLRLNIFPTRKRLAMLKKTPSPLCTCGQVETIDHLLRECYHQNNQRRQVWGANIPKTSAMLYGTLEHLRKTIKFLELTRRI